MFIDINKIRPDGVLLDEVLNLPDLEGPGRERHHVRRARLNGGAVPGERGVELTGRLDATVELPCSRCARPHVVDVTTDFSLTLVPDAVEYGVGEVELASEDATLFYAAEGKADLATIALEQIYLNLPLKPVCSKNCKGLCQRCGANLNETDCGCRAEPIDPRLAPLLEFKKD